MFFHDKLWHDYLGFSCSPAKTLEEWSKKGGIIKNDKRNDLKSYKENDQCPEGALIVFTRKESIGTAWQERENRFFTFSQEMRPLLFVTCWQGRKEEAPCQGPSTSPWLAPHLALQKFVLGKVPSRSQSLSRRRRSKSSPAADLVSVLANITIRFQVKTKNPQIIAMVVFFRRFPSVVTATAGLRLSRRWKRKSPGTGTRDLTKDKLKVTVTITNETCREDS